MMKKTRFSLCACAAVVAANLLGAGAASAAPAITNGSFEDPAIESGTLVEVSGTDTVPGWIFSSLGHEYLVSGDYNNFGTTPFGAQYLGLNGFRVGGPSVASQSVTGFLAGTTYAFSFYVANLGNGTRPNVVLDLSEGTSGSGDILDEQVYTAPGPGNHAFVQFTDSFTPTQDEDITFSIRSASNGILGIDNVSLAAVPEPTATAALALGTGVLAWTGLRRRAQQGAGC